MLISVYMPTKNRAGMLSNAIDSVLRQTYENFELLIVNDGSDDDTAAVIERARSADPRVRVIHNSQSVGGAAARNIAILEARGEFVTGLDDDDEFTPDRLESFVLAWERFRLSGSTAPSCLYSQLNVVEFGKITHQTNKPDLARFEDMFVENVVGNQIFAPRSHFLDAGLFNPELPAWQDLEFFMRVLKLFGPGRLVNKATYNFENSPRKDRISQRSEDKLRRALGILVDSHTHGNGRRVQMLYLQLFARLYGVKPSIKDYTKFASLGLWFPGFVGLIKATLR